MIVSPLPVIACHWIPACPESVFKKDSRLLNAFWIAGMTNDGYLYTDTNQGPNGKIVGLRSISIVLAGPDRD